MRTFLRRRFLISNPADVQLGPLEPSPISGVLTQSVRLTNDRGQTAHAKVFTDRQQRWIILGQLFDLDKGAWRRTDLSVIRLKDRPVLGPADAPVTIVEFGDFECPYCAHAFLELETMIHSTYRGKVRLIFKDFPLSQHPWAMRAALAAQCARLQNPDAFWKFARDFYTHQSVISAQTIGSYINNTAKGMGLDTGLLDQCMQGRAAARYVGRDMADGHRVGVDSTPTFFVNGIKMVGLPDKKAFRFLVQQEIDSANEHAHR